ncbi:FtsX-like permease family protein, partial [candidate division KSB1 bacterium]|nr:FtsX-like permease family protein [candidate division KSB1 bacterium]NIS25192.1 FtsX-like permease family protein [candidate division KSB1 bacterium]NIT72090.1 FtsX-like permease family protein [candidate division KSB1 bacterium]NIU25897.1 FtsX-like permease family protein [candidate division KSB1 bacterium]NIU91683.1 FtsX-like permease family protein [candidate division KSB1 bacterium]
REIGMRKTLGAYRGQLACQLLTESLLAAFIAMVLAILLMEFFLPLFNTLSEKSLALDLFSDSTAVLRLVGIVLIAGLIAGSYPAFVLSGFKPVLALNTSVSRGMQSVRLRKILVIFQFAASIVLIIATLVVSNQLSFMRKKNLGFDKEHMIVIPIRNNADIRGRFEAIKSELSKIPAVKNAASSSTVPGREIPSIVFRPEGASEKETRSINTLVVDYDFLATYNIQLAAGRAFSRDFTTDAQEGFIINEAAVKNLDWGEADDAIGKQFTWGWPGKEGRIIGVARDFHYNSLHRLVEPVVMHIQPGWLQYLSLKVETREIDRVLSELEKTWQRLVPSRPFDYVFLDENFDRQYRSEEKLSRLFMVFAELAIFVACLGLYSLAALTAEQRTKEVGVRKVFGATVANLVALLSKDFLKLVAIATIIAWPFAGLVLTRWLQDFAYRISLERNLWVFALAGGLALVIALLTVSTQAVRA